MSFAAPFVSSTYKVEDQWIDYNGHLEIHSSLLSVVLHDEPHINR